MDDVRALIADACGDHADDFDIDTIADEITEWYTYRDANGNGRESLSGYRLKEQYADDGDADNQAFWAVVERNDRTA